MLSSTRINKPYINRQISISSSNNCSLIVDLSSMPNMRNVRIAMFYPRSAVSFSGIVSSTSPTTTTTIPTITNHTVDVAGLFAWDNKHVVAGVPFVIRNLGADWGGFRDSSLRLS